MTMRRRELANLRVRILPELLELRNAGWTYAQLEEKYGVHRSTLSNWCKREPQGKHYTDDMLEPVYQFIVQFKQMSNGNTPTVGLLREALDLSEKFATHAVYRLVELGRLKFVAAPNRSRLMIEVIGGEWTPPADFVPDPELRGAIRKAQAFLSGRFRVSYRQDTKRKVGDMFVSASGEATRIWEIHKFTRDAVVFRCINDAVPERRITHSALRRSYNFVKGAP